MITRMSTIIRIPMITRMLTIIRIRIRMKVRSLSRPCMACILATTVRTAASCA